MNAYAWLTVVIALLVFGEALALWAGMYLLSPSDNPWKTSRNTNLLLVDSFAGFSLLLFPFAGVGFLTLPLAGGMQIILILTHAYRLWEYIREHENCFCANRALFWFNNLKLLGLLVIFVWPWF